MTLSRRLPLPPLLFPQVLSGITKSRKDWELKAALEWDLCWASPVCQVPGLALEISENQAFLGPRLPGAQKADWIGSAGDIFHGGGWGGGW